MNPLLSLLKRLSVANNTAELKLLTAELKKKKFSVEEYLQIILNINEEESTIRRMAAIELRRVLLQSSSSSSTIRTKVDDLSGILLEFVINNPNDVILNSILSVLCCRMTVHNVLSVLLDDNIKLKLIQGILENDESLESVDIIKSLSEYLLSCNGSEEALLADSIVLLLENIYSLNSEYDSESASSAASSAASAASSAAAEFKLQFEFLLLQKIFQLNQLSCITSVFSLDGFKDERSHLLMKEYILYCIDKLKTTSVVGKEEDNDNKEALMNVLLFAVYYQKNTVLLKYQLIPLVLECVFVLFSTHSKYYKEDDDDDEEEEEEDNQEEAVQLVGLRILNALSLVLNPALVFDSVFSYSLQLPCRLLGMYCVQQCVEGCSDYIRNDFKLSRVFEELLLVSGQGHQEVDFTDLLYELCVHVCDGVVLKKYSCKILPVLYQMVSSSNNTRVIKKGLQCLDVYLEELDCDTCMEYSDVLVQKFLSLLYESTTTASNFSDGVLQNDELVQVFVLCVSCLGSVSYALKQQYKKYYPDTMASLKQLYTVLSAATGNSNADEKTANLMQENRIQLMSALVDCLTALSTAVGKDVFVADVEYWMNVCLQYCRPESGLAECGFLFYGALVKLYGKDLLQKYGQAIVGVLFESLERDEEEELQDDDEEAESESGWVAGQGEEKEAALDVLGTMFETIGQDFLPFLQKTAELALRLSKSHAVDNVRKAGISCLLKCMKCLFKICHPLDSESVSNLTTLSQLHQDVKKFASLVLGECVKMYKNEYEMTVVGRINTDLVKFFDECGKNAVVVLQLQPVGTKKNTNNSTANFLNQLSECLLLLLQRKLPCQEFSEGEADFTEYDGVLISSGVDVIEALCKNVGSEYAPYFCHFWPLIAQYYKPSCAVSDRSMVIGLIGESVSGLGTGLLQTPNGVGEKVLTEMVHLCFSAFEDPDDEVKSNAVYSFGRLCALPQCKAAVPQLLMKVPQLQAVDCAVLKDNIVGCLCRLTISYPEYASTTVPVILNSVPLLQDYAEYTPFLELFEGLLVSQQQQGSFAGDNQKLAHVCSNLVQMQNEDKLQLNEQMKRQVMTILTKCGEMMGNNVLAQNAAVILNGGLKH